MNCRTFSHDPVQRGNATTIIGVDRNGGRGEAGGGGDGGRGGRD